MMCMLYYEFKKLFSRTGSKLLVVLLGAILLMMEIYQIQSVTYVKPDGTSISGFGAISKLKESKSQWDGYLTEEQIQKVLQTKQDILKDHPEYYPGTTDIDLSNQVYSLTQGFGDIRDMINQSYSLFGQFDYYLIDRLSPLQSSDFYKNRIEGLENYLNANDTLSVSQKEYYRKQYKENKTPWYYSYQQGWQVLANSLSVLQIFTVVVISLLLASIFSYEEKTGAKQIVMSSYKGKSKGVVSKISAGLLLTLGLYIFVVGIYMLIILSVFGFEGAFDPVQTNFFIGWKSPWNISNIQAIGILFISGLIGALIFSSITMFISYKTKSTVMASTVSFLLILLPDWLTNFISDSSMVTWLKLFPDQLLNAKTNLTGFTFLEIQGHMISPLTIMNVAYVVLTIILLMIIYVSAKKEYVK